MGGSPEPEPPVAPETVMREFAFRAVLTGAILGPLFGAHVLYRGAGAVPGGRPPDTRRNG